MGLYRDKFSFTFNSAQSEEKDVCHCQAAAPVALFMQLLLYLSQFLKYLLLLLLLLLLCMLQLCSPVLMLHLSDNM